MANKKILFWGIGVILFISSFLITLKLLPKVITYEAEVIGKTTMILQDGRKSEFCVQIEYEVSPTHTVQEWLCNEWAFNVNYYEVEEGDIILYKRFEVE